jgi:hypothetical protein
MTTSNSGTFRPGPDRRRHTFTAEQCRRGGEVRWWQKMIEVRVSMGLNLPLPPVHAQPAVVSRIMDEARRRAGLRQGDDEGTHG